MGGYDLDLTGASRARMTVAVDVGGRARELTLLGPRRREARALEALSEAIRAQAQGDAPDYLDALYSTAALVLSRNDAGEEFDAGELADELTVDECARIVEAYWGLKSAQEERRGNA